jgi:hypothetical protein
MKRLSLIISALLGCLFLHAQQPADKFKDLTKPGNKVYVTSNRKEMIDRARKLVKEGCWKVVANPKDADFVIKVEAKRIVTQGMFAYALFLEPSTKEVLLKTGTSSTTWRMTFDNKGAVLKKLIRRRVLPLCTPDYIHKDNGVDEY